MICYCLFYKTPTIHFITYLFTCMPSWRHIHFEGKHIDEKVLHFARPAKVQTIFEVFQVLIPLLVIVIIFISTWSLELLSWASTLFIIILISLFAGITIGYKLYRAKRNYLYVTSKRILFHGIEWLFKDYVKKITYENIRNVNYSTDSLLWKIFWYGTLSIQSSHGGEGDITVYHINYGKMITHYIDKVISLTPEQRSEFAEFDASYFKTWKK